MGWNSTVVILHDCLDMIEKDADFGKKLSKGIMQMQTPSHYVLPGEGTGFRVVESHHADSTTLVAVGGNCGTNLITTYGWNHHTEEGQIRLLKELADKYGYNLRKKPLHKG